MWSLLSSYGSNAFRHFQISLGGKAIPSRASALARTMSSVNGNRWGILEQTLCSYPVQLTWCLASVSPTLALREVLGRTAHGPALQEPRWHQKGVGWSGWGFLGGKAPKERKKDYTLSCSHLSEPLCTNGVSGTCQPLTESCRSIPPHLDPSLKAPVCPGALLCCLWLSGLSGPKLPSLLRYPKPSTVPACFQMMIFFCIFPCSVPDLCCEPGS